MTVMYIYQANFISLYGYYSKHNCILRARWQPPKLEGRAWSSQQMG